MLDAAKIRVCSVVNTDEADGLLVAILPYHPGWAHAATLFTGPNSCTDATAHPQHGHHRTTSGTTGSVRSPGRCTPQRQAGRHDTTALDRRSRLPLFPSQHLMPPFYSRWAAPVSALTGMGSLGWLEMVRLHLTRNVLSRVMKLVFAGLHRVHSHICCA
jgi:hypothetical protein